MSLQPKAVESVDTVQPAVEGNVDGTKTQCFNRKINKADVLPKKVHSKRAGGPSDGGQRRNITPSLTVSSVSERALKKHIKTRLLSPWCQDFYVSDVTVVMPGITVAKSKYSAKVTTG